MTSTPRHTVGSSVYFIPAFGALFTGDTFMADEATTTYRPTGNASDLERSTQEFLVMDFDDAMRILPGHGPSTTYGCLIQTNPTMTAPDRLATTGGSSAECEQGNE